MGESVLFFFASSVSHNLRGRDDDRVQADTSSHKEKAGKDTHTPSE